MRSNTLDAARRAYLGLVRGTVNAASDQPKLQTLDVRGLHNELITGAENFAQPYGFKSVPLPPDQQGMKAAEALIGFLNGNRSHPVILGHIDRRYSQTGWHPGESGLWHYKGASAKLTETGFQHNSGNDKQPATWTVGNCTVTWADGKATIDVGGTKFVVTPGKIALGDDSASIPVMLQTGPSQLVFATK